MLYTRKGDTGTTKDFNSKSGERKSKASCQTEALGALDELNSFLGLVKVKSAGVDWKIDDRTPAELVHWLQDCLFTIQAEVAGADKRLGETQVKEVERLTDLIEKELPPIKTFFVSGGTEVSALFDIARTIARRTERRVVEAVECGEIKLGSATLAFLNRISSILYALARLANYKAGIKERSPMYD